MHTDQSGFIDVHHKLHLVSDKNMLHLQHEPFDQANSSSGNQAAVP